MMNSKEILTSDPDILGGENVFAGTRVPVRSLLDYLAGGQTLTDFLEDFPSVSRELAEAAINLAREALTASASPS
jgi:uncharacterized protein (DUF433 family)